MKYLQIKNKGLLEIALVALMGGTTKSKDLFKIGQFGTGLKYTLAYLFRNNIDFKIFVGTEQVKITLEQEIIREETFEIICINGKRTSITTKMGEDWEPWMIIRELWCNALDEGEAVKAETESPVGAEGCTSFFIQIDSEIRKVLEKWDTYFIHDLTPMSTNTLFDIYRGGESLKLYKNGVLIHEDKRFPAVFSYDIKQAEINELREFKGTVTYQMIQALAVANPKVIEYFLETVKDEHYEGQMDYNWFTQFGSAWVETIGNARLIHQKAIDIINDRGAPLDTAGCIIVPEKVYKFLTSQFKGIGLLRTADAVNEFYEIHSDELMSRVKEALVILEECEYFIHPELKFVCGVFGDKRTLAKISFDTKEIFVSEKLLDKSLFQMVGMIIEENEHFKTGYEDESREFQQHFIDLYTKTLLDKNAIKL